MDSRQGTQLPSFGAIPEEEPAQRTVNPEKPSQSRLEGNRVRDPTDPFQKQRSFSHFLTEGSSLIQQVADLKMMGEMEVVRRQQLEALESLKSEIKEMKQFGGLSTAAIDRISSIDSSSYQESNTNSDQRPTTREVLLNGQKKNLEVELSARLRQIERMLMKERELHNTIHELRMELDCRVDEKAFDDANRQIHKLEFTVEKLKGELKEANSERERLSSENGSMKKQLLRKEFESKLFVEQNSRGNEKELTEMTRKCEDLNDLITQLKSDLARRTEEAEGRLAEQKDELEKSLRESVQSILNKNLNFYQQFKEDLTKLDKLKSKIIKEVKDNRSAFDSFDTQVEYETIFGGLIARLEHLYTCKGEPPGEGVVTIMKQSNIMRQSGVAKLPERSIVVEELRVKNKQLNEEVSRLSNFIEVENQAKRRFLSEIQESKLTHQAVFRQRDALKREINDLRIVIKEYQKIAETNTFLETEMSRLQLDNEQLLRDNSRLVTEREEFLKENRHPSEEQLNVLKQESEELATHKAAVEEQCRRVTFELEELRSLIRTIQQQNRSLKHKLSENEEYITQIESALMQVQPKLPEIFKKREGQDNASEQEITVLKGRVSQLQQLLAAAEAARFGELTNNQHMQHTIRQLVTDVERLHAQCKTLAAENIELQRSRDQLLNQHQKEVSQLFMSQADSQRKIHSTQTHLEDELKRYRIDIQRLEAQRSEYLDVIKQLTKENSRKEDELRNKETLIHTKELSLQKEVSRLASEAAMLKRNYDLQLERMSSSESDTSKGITQRYEREIQQLQLTIQQQQNDLKQTHSLQLQLGQIQLMARELAQSKERSMAVDHLWEIKRVEFGNALAQLAHLRAMANQ